MARARAIAPVPVPKSNTFAFSMTGSAKASSTRVSVSCLGINVDSSTAKLSDQKSCEPVINAIGFPFSLCESISVKASTILASTMSWACAICQLCPFPLTCSNNTLASNEGSLNVRSSCEAIFAFAASSSSATVSDWLLSCNIKN